MKTLFTICTLLLSLGANAEYPTSGGNINSRIMKINTQNQKIQQNMEMKMNTSIFKNKKIHYEIDGFEANCSDTIQQTVYQSTSLSTIEDQLKQCNSVEHFIHNKETGTENIPTLFDSSKVSHTFENYFLEKQQPSLLDNPYPKMKIEHVSFLLNSHQDVNGNLKVNYQFSKEVKNPHDSKSHFHPTSYALVEKNEHTLVKGERLLEQNQSLLLVKTYPKNKNLGFILIKTQIEE